MEKMIATCTQKINIPLIKEVTHNETIISLKQGFYNYSIYTIVAPPILLQTPWKWLLRIFNEDQNQFRIHLTYVDFSDVHQQSPTFTDIMCLQQVNIMPPWKTTK